MNAIRFPFDLRRRDDTTQHSAAELRDAVALHIEQVLSDCAAGHISLADAAENIQTLTLGLLDQLMNPSRV